MNQEAARKFNTLLLIIIKTFVLVLIVLCIFFIAYPNACMNIITGRETGEAVVGDINQPLTPAAKDVPIDPAAQQTAPVQETTVANTETIIVHPPAPAQQAAPQTVPPVVDQDAIIAAQQKAQDEFDYAVIKRYVEIEKELLATRPNNKETADLIIAQVMREHNLTAQDWQEIVLKANEKGWFKELRGK